jgi:hypothetical protein
MPVYLRGYSIQTLKRRERRDPWRFRRTLNFLFFDVFPTILLRSGFYERPSMVYRFGLKLHDGRSAY